MLYNALYFSSRQHCIRFRKLHCIWFYTSNQLSFNNPHERFVYSEPCHISGQWRSWFVKQHTLVPAILARPSTIRNPPTVAVQVYASPSCHTVVSAFVGLFYSENFDLLLLLKQTFTERAGGSVTGCPFPFNFKWGCLNHPSTLLYLSSLEL